ncbi:MAG: SMI1/KNR4 family protein [Nannocystaceae bacterium]
MSAQQIHEVMEYIGRLDPGVRSRMVGASDAEISTLEALAGVKLCASHRAWLQHLGNTPFNALAPLFYDYSFAIADAQEFYARIGPEPTAMLGRAAFLFHHEIDEMLYTVQPDDPEEDPPLTDIPFDDNGLPAPYESLHDPSFAAWIVYEAFSDLFVYRQEHQFELMPREDPSVSPDALREEIEAIAARLGFTRVPQSRGTYLLYERGDVVLEFGKSEWTAFGVGVAGSDERRVRHVVELLHDRYGGSVKRSLRNPRHG